MNRRISRPHPQSADHGVPFDLDDLKIRLASGQLGETYEARAPSDPYRPRAGLICFCGIQTHAGCAGAELPRSPLLNTSLVSLRPWQAAILRLEKEIEDVAAGKDRLRMAAKTLAAKLELDGVRNTLLPVCLCIRLLVRSRSLHSAGTHCAAWAGPQPTTMHYLHLHRRMRS